MLTLLNDLIVSGADVLLGWMLHFGQLFALVVVALGTSAVLTFIRPWTTNQDLLKRCKGDKNRLKELIREAKARKQKEAVKRYRQTIASIGIKQMNAEGKPLLFALIPVACLAVWAFARLAYVPPEPNEPITVKAWFRSSSIGSAAHIAPVDGLEAETTESGGWVQRIVEDPEVAPDGKKTGMAVWTLRAEKRDEPYVLRIRSRGETVEKPMIVDGTLYSATLEVYQGPIEAAQIDLQPYKPLGIVPGIPWIHFEKAEGFPWFRVYTKDNEASFLDPWLVGYLIITIPFVFLLRRIANIH